MVKYYIIVYFFIKTNMCNETLKSIS